MSTHTTIANFDPALKNIYDPRNVGDTTLKSRVLFGMLPKFGEFGGREMPIVSQFGNPQGRSAEFTKAQANITAPSMQDFRLTRVNNYSLARISGEVMEATASDRMAFLGAAKTSIDGALNALANSVETQLFRSGTGSIGTIGSFPAATTNPTSSGDVVALTDPEDIVNIELGMKLVFSTGDGAAVGSATELKVTAVNRSTGQFTCSGDIDSVSAALADHIYQSGDEQNGGTAAKAISGLSAWCPSTVTSAAFFGVDRTVDTRLSGNFYDASGGTDIADALLIGASISAREGASASTVILHHTQMRALQQELGSAHRYSEVNAQSVKGTVANIGYRGISVQSDAGEVTVVSSNRCQGDVAWMLDMSTWTLSTIQEPIRVLNSDPKSKTPLLTVHNDDAGEARCVFRGNLGCHSPGFNTRIALSAVS